jgi:hypothetical protein
MVDRVRTDAAIIAARDAVRPPWPTWRQTAELQRIRERHGDHVIHVGKGPLRDVVVDGLPFRVNAVVVMIEHRRRPVLIEP